MVNTKYNFKIDDKVIESDINRLTNQLWKLIPMREKEENWLEHLKSVIIEIAGLNEIFAENVNYLILLSKLEGLKNNDEIEFNLYRKTIFESISLLRGIMHD